MNDVNRRHPPDPDGPEEDTPEESGVLLYIYGGLGGTLLGFLSGAFLFPPLGPYGLGSLCVGSVLGTWGGIVLVLIVRHTVK